MFQGQFDEAIQCLEAAGECEWPERIHCWLGLALVHHHAGDSDQAREYLAKAQEGQRGKPLDSRGTGLSSK